jgi:hypothetical protein
VWWWATDACGTRITSSGLELAMEAGYFFIISMKPLEYYH